MSDGPNPPDETGGSTAAEPVAWYDSADPRKRRVARIALIVLWIYVGALWLLAMDQTFDWGIFGPKTPILD